MERKPIYYQNQVKLTTDRAEQVIQIHAKKGHGNRVFEQEKDKKNSMPCSYLITDSRLQEYMPYWWNSQTGRTQRYHDRREFVSVDYKGNKKLFVQEKNATKWERLT